MRTLIKVNGFIGDVLFASSVADYMTDFDTVDYVINVYQPYELLMNNNHIDRVFINGVDSYNYKDYDSYYEIGSIDQSKPATIQFQEQCGIIKPQLEYKVYTNPRLDEVAKSMLRHLKMQGKKLVAVQQNWKERSFLFTEEEYERGIDVPNLGYGGKHRDTDSIVNQLSEMDEIALIPVGFEDGVGQHDIGFMSTSIYSMTASLIKQCDWMVGAEGGLTNLAAGVGTKTIITTDFIWQLYGPNGVLKKIDEPQMGPYTYFPHNGHHWLNPFMPDELVAPYIRKIVNG